MRSTICRVILVWACLATVIALYLAFQNDVWNLAYGIKRYLLKNADIVDKKSAVTKEIIRIRSQFQDLEKERKVNSLLEELVSIDSLDISNLISYGVSCITLALNEEQHSAKSLRLRIQSLKIAGHLQEIGDNELRALINAAHLYSLNGVYESIYYDSCDAVYDRIALLAETDSLHVPESALHDKLVWKNELLETIHDLKFYNRMTQRTEKRKYPFPW